MVNTVSLNLKKINPVVNKLYRSVFYSGKDTLNGVYSKQLVRDVNLFLEYCEGNIVLEGDLDFEDYRLPVVLHAQEDRFCQDIILRKNESEDLTRVFIRNLPVETFEKLEHVTQKLCGRFYRNASRLINMAMVFSLKLYKGVTRVEECSRRLVEHVVRDGVVSPLEEKMVDSFKRVESRFDKLEEFMLNFRGFKAPKKFFKKQGKRDKTVRVLNEVKKCNERFFTRSDYKRALVRLVGQGDDRTVDSDLELLVASGVVIEDRMVGYSGSMRYQFKDNLFYDEYQGPGAMRRFVEKFKVEFGARSQTTKTEVVDFIGRVFGLVDVKSVVRRFDVLLTAGYLMPYDIHGRVFNLNV